MRAARMLPGTWMVQHPGAVHAHAAPVLDGHTVQCTIAIPRQTMQLLPERIFKLNFSTVQSTCVYDTIKQLQNKKCLYNFTAATERSVECSQACRDNDCNPDSVTPCTCLRVMSATQTADAAACSLQHTSPTERRHCMQLCVLHFKCAAVAMVDLRPRLPEWQLPNHSMHAHM
jgi:hypothetical protein